VAGLYGNLSWMQLLAGNFSQSIEAAQHGLDLDPSLLWIEANLAHGLLLTGKQQEAVEHYMNARKGKLNDRSLLDATREDFGTLKSLGYGSPAMDRILQQMSSD
jgi:hypothetical protein